LIGIPISIIDGVCNEFIFLEPIQMCDVYKKKSIDDDLSKQVADEMNQQRGRGKS
jgi:hypothetical protein